MRIFFKRYFCSGAPSDVFKTTIRQFSRILLSCIVYWVKSLLKILNHYQIAKSIVHHNIYPRTFNRICFDFLFLHLCVGYILGTVDEITQILDDNAMNLQSMTASRFVGPFLKSVNDWEKSLSHISEVVEVRMQFRCVVPFLKFSFTVKRKLYFGKIEPWRESMVW